MADLPLFNTLPADFSPSTDLLKDRVILVTGAGQGLGKAAALAFARHGATVILHGRNVPKLEATYDEIEAAGAPQPAIMPLDFAKATQGDFDAFAQSILLTLKRLDGIFHGASHFSPLMPLGLQELAAWQAHLTVNLAAPAALTKACLPLLKRAPAGRVVWLSETHAIAPKAFWGAFAAAKSALLPLATIWQAEMMPEDALRFHVCVPGPVASPARAKSHPGEASESLPTAESLTPHFLYLMSGKDAAPGGSTTILYKCDANP
jgi:NAD(P)-dependent dehydrogenase (short-subunit alcohol dehydrogenase family)